MCTVSIYCITNRAYYCA